MTQGEVQTELVLTAQRLARLSASFAEQVEGGQDSDALQETLRAIFQNASEGIFLAEHMNQDSVWHGI